MAQNEWNNPLDRRGKGTDIHVLPVGIGIRIASFLHSLLNQCMDFDQTCTETSLRQGKEMIRFWWPWPHFQCHTSTLTGRKPPLKKSSRLFKIISSHANHEAGIKEDYFFLILCRPSQLDTTAYIRWRHIGTFEWLSEFCLHDKYMWARSWENVSYAICEQQRCISACTSAVWSASLSFAA